LSLVDTIKINNMKINWDEESPFDNKFNLWFNAQTQ